MSVIALRPYLPADAPILAELFRASIDVLAADEYSDAQRAAWITLADDEAAFARKLAGGLTLIATIDAHIAGFASLKGADVVDLLYVHPDHARQGVASALVDALEKLGAARGATKFTAEASDTARAFFARRGYEAQSRKVSPLGDEWLANTTMVKNLAPVEAPSNALH